MNGFQDTANSDPAKVARLVLAMAELDHPPLRILAGSDAYEYGRDAWRARIETDARWEQLSRSTDHNDAGDTWRAQRGSSLPNVEEPSAIGGRPGVSPFGADERSGRGAHRR
jgi:hypothetical protein